MSILLPTERRRNRALLIGMHAALCLGGACMLLPFLVLVSSSMKSADDAGDLKIIPRFCYSEPQLFRKFLTSRYNNYAYSALSYFKLPQYTPETLPPPEWTPQAQRRAENYAEFLKAERSARPAYWRNIAMAYEKGVEPLAARQFRQWLRTQPEGSSLAVLNAECGTAFTDWMAVTPPAEYLLWHRADTDYSRGFLALVGRFKDSAECSELITLFPDAEGDFITMLREQISTDLTALNTELGTAFTDWAEIVLLEHYPGDAPPRFRECWEQYARFTVNPDFVSVDSAPAERTALESGAVPAEAIRLHTLSGDYRRWLRGKYHGDAALWRSDEGRSETEEFHTARVPSLEYEWNLMRTHRSELIWEYISRSYRMVVNYIIGYGNSARNTFWFCLLAVLGAITINPLAAFTLARRKSTAARRAVIGIFLPMVFPMMVMSIPQFLMLQKLGLLNSIAALVLPGLASGYSILLFKECFEAIPQELMDAAELDGASPLQCFRHIALPLAKPLLAVTALNAFAAAYGDFMLAMLLCQKPAAWTLMVQIHQLQLNSAPEIGFAAIIISAIPTLIAFIACQHVILNGMPLTLSNK